MSSPDEPNPTDLFASMIGGDDKLVMAIMAEKQLDIMLKYLQVLWYASELDETLYKNLERRLKPMIDLATDNMDKQVQEYQKKHGEI